VTYLDHLTGKNARRRARQAAWMKRYLPPGYSARQELGAWDLFAPDRRPVRTSIFDRRDVVKVARLHAAGKRLPYQWSAAFWEDIRHGRRWRVWRARFAWFLRRELPIW